MSTTESHGVEDYTTHTLQWDMDGAALAGAAGTVSMILILQTHTGVAGV